MFSYCLNNPVQYFDDTGMRATSMICLDCVGSVVKPTWIIEPKKKVAVIYDNRTSGYLFGRFGGKGFRHQGKELVNRLSEDYDVTCRTFSNMGEFISGWNSLDGEYDALYILAHGWYGELSCAGETLSSQNTEYSFSQLNYVNTNMVYLYACNGATIDAYGSCTAIYLSNITKSTVRALRDGKLNFSWEGCYPIPDSGYWVNIYPSS